MNSTTAYQPAYFYVQYVNILGIVYSVSCALFDIDLLYCDMQHRANSMSMPNISNQVITLGEAIIRCNININTHSFSYSSHPFIFSYQQNTSKVFGKYLSDTIHFSPLYSHTEWVFHFSLWPSSDNVIHHPFPHFNDRSTSSDWCDMMLYLWLISHRRTINSPRVANVQQL